MKPISIRSNVDLTDLNSLRVRAHARSLFELTDDSQLEPALQWLGDQSEPCVLGGGSNVLLTRDKVDAVLINALPGRRIVSERDDKVLVALAAGENWHDTVQWLLANQCYGLENLSLIPGRVGAAPVQNIGAYGVELADYVHSVSAIRLSDRSRHQLTREACAFAYRDSLFKRERGQWLITGITLLLDRKPTLKLDYGDIRDDLNARKISDPTPEQVAQTVCRIRQQKLPDPAVLPNAGSFFKNPVVSEPTANELTARYPNMPRYAGSKAGTVKLAAAWLIEQAGYKGVREADAGTHAHHALVIVNYGSASGQELMALAQKIQQAVHAKFQVSLEPEPVFIPSV